MSKQLDASQCRQLIAELASLLPHVLRTQSARRYISFREEVYDPTHRARWDPVFAGGGIVQLLITDPAAPPASLTKDVDAVLEVASYTDYTEIEEALRIAGLTQSFQDEAAIVAWQWKGVRIDILPHRAIPLIATTNRWFPFVLEDAVRHEIDAGRFAWIASAPTFIATKFEAFFSRGEDDFLKSKDMEDILAVVDGRAELPSELHRAPREAAMFVRKCFSEILSRRVFRDCLPYLVPDDGREQVVLRRLESMVDG